MRKKSIACGLILAMAMSLVGCGSNKGNNSDNTSENAASKSSFSVAMVTDTGGVNDQSFNQSAWEGLSELKAEYGVEANYVESVQEADYATNLDKFVDSDADLIWGVGFSVANAMQSNASMNPGQLYAIIDHTYGDETLDNVACVMFRAQESSFLVGYVAGKTTKTDKVGFVGGIPSDIISQFEYGYRAGVAYAAKELGKKIDVTVQYAESFSDAAKGKAIATKMYSDGCDIIFQSAGNAGTGVIEAAKDTGKLAIGVDRDQLSLAPDNVLTSALKQVSSAVKLVTLDAMNGKQIGGKTFNYGLTEDAVGIPAENPNMDPAVYDATMEVQQLIIDGTIVPPYNQETFDQFIESL